METLFTLVRLANNFTPSSQEQLNTHTVPLCPHLCRAFPLHNIHTHSLLDPPEFVSAASIHDTETETSSTHLPCALWGLEPQGLKPFCLCKLYYSLLVTAFSKLWGTTGFRENCEVQGEDSLDHNDTRFRRDCISNHSSINICMWHCKIMSPLSFLFLRHYLHFIRTRTFMTLKVGTGTDPTKKQFKLIWSVRCCSKWWIRRNLLLLENILHRFTNTEHLFT